MVKGGFIFGGKGGKGVATCRTANGWSAPAFITISGGSWGLQIGVEAVDVVLIIQNDKGVQKLLSSNFQIGADASAAAGPVGRHAEAGTDWKLDTEILTYSRAKGAFAGLTLEGASLRQDNDSRARDLRTQRHNSGHTVGQSASSIRSQAVPRGSSRSKSPSRLRGERQKVGLRFRSTINPFERTTRCDLKKVGPQEDPGGLPCLTRSARDSACIFRMTLARWTFMVISLVPSSAAICLFSRPRDHQGEDLSFARGQRFKPLPQHCNFRLFLTSAAVAFQGNLNRIQQILIAEWFGQEFDRPRLHGPHGHGDITVAGDKYDRNANVSLGQLVLEIEPADPW